MGMNQTPAAERVHIVFLGRRNAGKSSVMNAVTGQELSVVSEVKGTTTDPVQKTMELLPLGPVVLVDTPGIDDEGKLGELRVRKSRQQLNRADIAVLVVDAAEGMQEADRELLGLIRKKGLPHLIVFNKEDLLGGRSDEVRTEMAVQGMGENPDGSGKNEVFMDRTEKPVEETVLRVSARTGSGIRELKEAIAHLRPTEEEHSLLDGIVQPGDTVVLVVPIDKAAPKGRLILPQQMTIRALLDLGAAAVVTRETELAETLQRLSIPPALVITDSQAFGAVSKIVPQDCPLTSFSILMARYKGDLAQNVRGVEALKTLRDGDRVLISEGCTHHRQCGDIGTVKLPAWIREYTGKELEYVTSSGTEFPEDLSSFGLIVHCGGCMLTEREMRYRLACAADQGVPMTNYGTLIAEVHGILRRSLIPLDRANGSKRGF